MPLSMAATSQKQEVKAPKISVILMLVFVLGLTAFIVWGIYKAAFPPAPPLQGQMESRTISVASKVPGRIHKVLVSEGDFVKANQPVALMSLPELEAKLQLSRLKKELPRQNKALLMKAHALRKSKPPVPRGSALRQQLL